MAELERWLGKDAKALLQPYAALLETMYGMIFNATDAEIDTLIAAADRPSEINCGWSIYQAAQLIKPELLSEQRRRAAIRAAVASDAGRGDG